MHEQENLKAIQEVDAAFGEGDIEGVLGMLTNDVRWTTLGLPDVIPYAGSKTGHERVAGYFESFGGRDHEIRTLDLDRRLAAGLRVRNRSPRPPP